ncbi:hypothetical protein EXM22_09400 [Oceanispirochaeta crateris]|uniref:Uncharacterized protein n=1 Tax=Oceanispirochaeta crateris TaxID=2518645 RepID=A0A5C1QKR2_9SPIO|nr:STM3941 family protein [Oceanispirochaeta crateris]QEN08191.1 hypothetical protein EXM22_09400 [Oceanispirochaeta crateris]
MTEIKLYKRRTKGLKIIGMCLPFVVSGLWFVLKKPVGTANYIIGWISTCFFGLGIPIGLFQTFDKRPQIIISENGICDRTTNQDEVKWEQVIKAYPIDIFGKKIVSIVTDDTFIFKKKPFNYTEKINKKIGAKNFNLHLGQVNINEIELSNFINRVSNENIEERRNLIKSFKTKKTKFSCYYLKKILFYTISSITILKLTLSSVIVFWIVIGLMGISAIVARFQPENMTLRKYAFIGVLLGFINFFLLFTTVEIYENITEKLVIRIEEFYKQNSTLPTDIILIEKDLELNFIELYFFNQINYRSFDNYYEFETRLIFRRRKTYYTNISEYKLLAPRI